jgi:hypothetical protein
MPTDEELTADELEQRQDLVPEAEDAEEVAEAGPAQPPSEADPADFYEQTRDVPGDEDEEGRA